MYYKSREELINNNENNYAEGRQRELEIVINGIADYMVG